MYWSYLVFRSLLGFVYRCGGIRLGCVRRYRWVLWIYDFNLIFILWRGLYCLFYGALGDRWVNVILVFILSRGGGLVVLGRLGWLVFLGLSLKISSVWLINIIWLTVLRLPFISFCFLKLNKDITLDAIITKISQNHFSLRLINPLI